MPCWYWRMRRLALLFGNLADRLPQPPQAGGRFRGLRTRGEYRFRGGQQLVEFHARRDRQLGNLPRQVRQPLGNPLDDRALLVEVPCGSFEAISSTRSTDGSRRNASLRDGHFLGRVGERQRKPGAVVGLIEELLLEFDAFQANRFEIQEVVVEAQVVHADGRQRGAHHGEQQRQPRIGEHRPQPEAQIQRQRQVVAAAVAVRQPDHGRQHGRGGEPAEQNAGPGDDAQLGHAGELGEAGGEKGDGGGQHGRSRCPAPRWTAVATRASSVDSGLTPQMEVSGDKIDAVVDSQADQNRTERDGEYRDVADRDRDAPAGPNHGQHAAAIAMVAWRNPPKATIITASTPKNDNSVANDIDRSLECISSYSMTGSPVEPDTRARMVCLNVGDEFAQGGDRLFVLGKAVLVFLQEAQQDEAHPAVIGDQAFRGGLARQRRQQHVGRRRLVWAVLAERARPDR